MSLYLQNRLLVLLDREGGVGCWYFQLEGIATSYNVIKKGCWYYFQLEGIATLCTTQWRQNPKQTKQNKELNKTQQLHLLHLFCTKHNKITMPATTPLHIYISTRKNTFGRFLLCSSCWLKLYKKWIQPMPPQKTLNSSAFGPFSINTSH